MLYKGERDMNSVCRDIFRAVHEGVWLSIEYQNKGQQVTKYWIGIKDIVAHKRALIVDGLHLGPVSYTHLCWVE